MEQRAPLKLHTTIAFEGMTCVVEDVIGLGSNAIVYKGWYADRLNAEQRHYVLIKELFPFHPQGKIRRGPDNRILVEPDAREHWNTHKESFLAGNEVHLRLLKDHPDMVGGNLNSFCANGTLYSILGYSGGRSLQSELNTSAQDLRRYARLMQSLLDGLEAFHKSGYLHLDISPDNIMLLGEGENERIFLIDFNSAHEIGAEDHAYLSCKPGYSAPEVTIGDRDGIGFSSDLYSVGAVFYRCLMGRTLTLEETLRAKAPDGKDSPCLENMPETVISMAGRILKKSLHTLPAKRYQSIGQMRLAFTELIDRIDCVGVTHWSLWENGKRSVEELIRINPSLRYVKEANKLYPIRLQDRESRQLSRYLEETLSPEGRSSLIVAQGGMGKTTLLLHTAMLHSKHYSPTTPAVFYIPLNGWNGKDSHYIRDRILMSLRFKPEMNSYASASHALRQLLDQPLKTRAGEIPTSLLLLDGLNEIHGDTAALVQEINELNKLSGVRIIATSRNEIPALELQTARLIPLEVEDVENALGRKGQLVPNSPAVLELLRTPLILSIYIQTGEAGKQLEIETEEELMGAYMAALLEKELKQLPEESPEKWQIDVALNYVLPAIASEVKKKGSALTGPQLLKVVAVCQKTLRSPLLQRVFPQWIGHSRDIFADAQTAEQWYGIVIHRILHKRLGLLTKDQNGGYRVFHQMVAEYLAVKSRKTAGHILRLRGTFAAVIGAAVLALAWALGSMAISYLQPKPTEPAVVAYDDTQTQLVIDHVAGCYVIYGSRLGEMQELTEYLERMDATEFLRSYDRYLKRAEQKTLLSEEADRYCEDILQLCNSGEQVSWSKLPFDGESGTMLLTEAKALTEEYLDIFPAMRAWLLSERAQRFCPDFPQVLRQALEADAGVMCKLYHMSCSPHLENGEEPWSGSVKSLIANIPEAGTEPAETLEHLQQKQFESKSDLVTLLATVQAAYNSEN